MDIKNFPYLLLYNRLNPDLNLTKGICYINPKFNKLMDLVGKAISQGKTITFVYEDNLISVKWRD